MPDNIELDRIILALLFASDEPLTPKRIAQILEIPSADIKSSIDRLTEWLEADRFSATIEPVANGFQLATRPEFSKYIARLYSGKRKQRLSKAGLETLAIIAYKQPITRAEIENIRGVSCGGVVTTLMERSLIRIAGKAKVLGSPFLYATTQEFLEYLGLNSLDDLPGLEELEALLEKELYREDESAEAPDADAPDVSAEEMESQAGPDAMAAPDIINEEPEFDDAVESTEPDSLEVNAQTPNDTENRKDTVTGEIPEAGETNPDQAKESAS